ALEHYNGTILAVSHDRYFLNKLFDKMYWIDDKEVHCFGGNYQYARDKMAEKAQRRNDDVVEKKRNASPPRKKEIETISKHDVEKELEMLEHKIMDVDQELDKNPDIEHAQQLYMQKVELEKQWEELFIQLEK